MRNRVRRTDKFIFLFSLFYVFLFLGVNTLTNGLDFLFTIPFNFLGVYVSYLLVLKQLDVKNKLADKICIAFSLKTDVMLHWNLLYLNCLGFFSDPGYLLLSLLPVPCLEKGRFGRSVYGDRRKDPSPGRAYRSQFEEKRQRTFRPYRFTGFAERNVCLGRAAVESCWRQEHDRSSFSVGKLAYL